MATLIPSLGSCVSRMTSGERRCAERLEQKLDDDYLVWYDVPVGPKQTHPDFVVLHPRRGLLILETKDWKLETIRSATRQACEIVPDGRLKVVMNPLAQARHCAVQVVDALQRDAQLTHAHGAHTGKLAFPWGYGVVLTRISRAQFDAAGLADAIEPHRVVCSDEMTEAVEPEAFQQRLWNMFPHAFGGVLSLPQIDRVRWILFPEVRVPDQVALAFEGDDADAELPDLMRVMDLQQEQLARSLGDGHRVIHGVAGSGKTMILGYRAELLAKAASATKPVLVLCYNEPLAVKLAATMAAKGLDDRVHVRHFHRWCRQQLVSYGQPIPTPREGLDAMFAAMVDNVIRAVERSQIPSGQYRAVLIDEGHDFQPAWLKLVTQMVDPETNSLLVLYDDAQSIYERGRKKTKTDGRQAFSFKSVGIQAQGRTTILKINYRNTRQILQTASRIAADLLVPDDGTAKDAAQAGAGGSAGTSGSNAVDDTDAADDAIPRLRPISCGRDGRAPLVIRLPTLADEAGRIATLLAEAHREGRGWGEMAVLCRHHDVMDACAAALRRLQLPHQVRRRAGSYDPSADRITVMTMHASKGLEFPLVALPGIGAMPADGETDADEARLFYVAATRATEQLVITLSGTGKYMHAFAE